MKKYDELVSIKSIQTNVVTFEIESCVSCLHDDRFIKYCMCRKCNNIHDISKSCEVCDLETKINDMGNVGKIKEFIKHYKASKDTAHYFVSLCYNNGGITIEQANILKEFIDK